MTANVAAPIRDPYAFVESPDFTKRPGRYQSDFVWNTDWQAQVDHFKEPPNISMTYKLENWADNEEEAT